jgi:uncharacterized damage-inducible protein DinB
MEQASLAKFWSDAWSDGLWAAPWHKSVSDLNAPQASWTPAPGRHSIWQIVEHMVFWREDNLRRLAGGPKPTPEQLATGNFPRIADTSEKAWRATLARFERSQQQIAAAIADERNALERLQYLLPHDCYHMGQISYLRALLGLKPIE